jgi:phospho-N-acetylmuramoyl-pentapeptide-transferase
MLYLLAHWLHYEGLSNLFRYQSFRAGAALLTALMFGLLVGPRFILMLRMKQGKGQPIREDGPQSHLAKRGTPTMGGLMIVTSLVIGLLLWMDLSSRYVWACLIVTLGFGLIGFLDDYDKVTKYAHKGVPARSACWANSSWRASRPGWWYRNQPLRADLQQPYIPLGPFYFLSPPS